MTDTSNPILRVERLSKHFPGVQALNNVQFRLFPGEVHSVMGQNGAGKSTLIKVLTGVHAPDSGEIMLDGQPIRPKGALDAQRLGISTVYQEVNLCPNLSVSENIFLGRDGSHTFGIRWKEMHRKAEALLSELRLSIDVTAPLASYSIAVQQLCAIARALAARAKILILDEPTSSLAEHEVELLFSVIRRLKSQGMAVLFVTHFLDQTFEISDRITVLRNGEFEGEYLISELSRLELVSKMVGREMTIGGTARAQRAQGIAKPAEAGPFLQAKALGRAGSVRDVDLELERSEAVALGGLLGAGRTEVARLLFGIDSPDTGSIRIQGQPAQLSSPQRAIEAGIGFCSEDRKREGIIGELSVRENIVLALQAKQGVFRNLPRKRQDEVVGRLIKLLGIKTPDAETPIEKLSGGNQQKALLARWMAIEPQLLILDEPTRGIDVAAKTEIMEQVMRLCDAGLAILFISSEMDEVLRYSDRIAIMRDRRKVAELSTAETDEQAVFGVIAEGRQCSPD